jgi:hypothetical protein
MRLSKAVATAEATPMLPTEDLFVYVYVLIDDLINASASASAIAIPPRPGPVPACGDAELLAITPVRHLLGRRSEAGFLAEVARDWAHLFGAGGWRWCRQSCGGTRGTVPPAWAGAGRGEISTIFGVGRWYRTAALDGGGRRQQRDRVSRQGDG